MLLNVANYEEENEHQNKRF